MESLACGVKKSKQSNYIFDKHAKLDEFIKKLWDQKFSEEVAELSFTYFLTVVSRQ